MAEVRQHLANRRVELDFTQQEVANAVGISRSSYAAIERGLRNPSLDVAQKISKKLKMPVIKAFPIKK